VSLHETVKLVALLHLIGGWQTLLLLSLVEHHLLDDAAGIVVQIAELAIFWFHLLGVDLLLALDDRVPPVLSLLLGQVQLQDARTLGVSFNAPGGVLNLDLLVPIALNKSFATLDLDLALLAGHNHIEHL